MSVQTKVPSILNSTLLAEEPATLAEIVIVVPTLMRLLFLGSVITICLVVVLGPPLALGVGSGEELGEELGRGLGAGEGEGPGGGGGLSIL